VSRGAAPASRDAGADEINTVFFSDVALPVDLNSPFHFAPPIWIQQDARFCADGSVLPGNAQIADSGYMPDLYLYAGSERIGLDGKPSGGPAQTGDFKRFSNPPTYINPFLTRNPWNRCQTDPSSSVFLDRRDGKPWELEFDTADDQSPDAVRLCDEPSPVDPSPHG
ncbi:MAG: hypothetical protein QOH83_2253, partial [Solirubrobacteraceae bacterium]|nr:hypothetical protein [Solirubrobacteraceae bacterium]